MASNPASSQKLGRPGIVFICGKSTKGKVALSSELLGQDIIHLAGNGRDLFVCTSNGLFSPSEKTFVSSFEGILASQYASGGQHAICLTPMGELYAWGNGPLGELGLGTVTKSTPQTPQKIQYNATFVSISCGADHSVAMDGCGNAFAWGQNRHRQLGLYNTLTSSSSSSSSNLTASFASSSSTKFKPETNFLIEDFLFVPRFLPFSLKNPVLKVACGSKFTLAVTKSGDIFSWGAGECGQLGNNGCSFKEVPSKIDMEGKSTIVDIAAGYAHCLALSSEGVLYSWGLNAKQELGLGEGHRRVKMCSAPMKVNVQSSSLIVKVAANVHSSACINQEGELFTWGSSSHGKLMHGEYDGRDIATPQLVEALRQSKVKEVLITSEEAAVFVPSSFDSLSPKSGPMKSFTRLTLFGCGFYPSENCIVRFKLQPSTRFSASKLLPHPSRSCQGTVVDQNNIMCIPPKLSTAGDYEVTLSLNGIDFLDNSFIVSVYPEPVVFSVEPKLIDASQASTFDIELVSTFLL